MLSKTELLEAAWRRGERPPKKIPKGPWTDEHIDWVIMLLTAGLSTHKIGPHLGTTGSAIIGLIHRNDRLSGWRGRGTHPKVRKVTRAEWSRMREAIVPKSLSRPRQELAGGDPCVPPPNITRQLKGPYRLSEDGGAIDVTKVSGCRDVYGDPLGDDWTFCGRPKVPGLSYCEFHAQRNLRGARPCVARSSSTSSTPSGTSSGSSGLASPSAGSAGAG